MRRRAKRMQRGLHAYLRCLGQGQNLAQYPSELQDMMIVLSVEKFKPQDTSSV